MQPTSAFVGGFLVFALANIISAAGEGESLYEIKEIRAPEVDSHESTNLTPLSDPWPVDTGIAPLYRAGLRPVPRKDQTAA